MGSKLHSGATPFSRNCDPRLRKKHTKALTGLDKTSSDMHGMASSLCCGDSSTLVGEIIPFKFTLERPCTHVLGYVCARLPVPVCYTIINSENLNKLLSSININKVIGRDGIPS